MKANFFTESILYWAARTLSEVTQRIPASSAVALGAWMGETAYRLLPRRRALALKNLRAAFGDRYDPAQYRAILKGMFRHWGMTLMEIAGIPRVDRAYADRWITFSPGTRKRMEAAFGQGKGVILLAAHFGSWELPPLMGSLAGYPVLVLARQQGWPRLNALLNRYRESKGAEVISKGFPIRKLIQGLREGKVLGMVADQDGGRRGVLAPFFGRLASTAPGAFALSLRTGAPILPVFLVRTQGPAHTLILEEPLVIPKRDPLGNLLSEEERIREGIEAYLTVLERYVRQYPHQWLWLHRRWKSSPERRVLLLSDGKAGHSTQALALAQRIEAAWKIRMRSDPRHRAGGQARLKGREESLVSIKTVLVAYRHPVWRGILTFLAGGFPRRMPWAHFWLRRALDPASYAALRSAYADYTISCGALTAPVNLIWARAFGAKAIQIHRTRWPSWRRFDLAILPRHDVEKGTAPNGDILQSRVSPRGLSPNLLVVEGALVPWVRINAEELPPWRDRLKLTKERQIGLLLGGPIPGIRLGVDQVQSVVVDLIAAAQKLDAELLMTSSRRTPPEVEELLYRTLANHPRCRLLVLVNRGVSNGLNRSSEAIPLILELAQVLVVSGDSISMVSEAVASAKPVVGFLPNGKGDWMEKPRLKHQRFLHQLGAQGKVFLVSPEKVGETVVEVIHQSDLVVPGKMVPGIGARHYSGKSAWHLFRVPGTNQRRPGTAVLDPIVERLVKWL